jgi:hypothetical protein
MDGANCIISVKVTAKEMHMKVKAAALVVVSAALSWSAQAEVLALRCEGAKVVREIKEPDNFKTIFPGLPGGEEDKGTKDSRTQEQVSTDVVVANGEVHAFGVRFEEGASNDAFVRFLRSVNNPEIRVFVLEGFFGEVNRVSGILAATQLKYKKNGWLYLQIEYSLNCERMERKF